MCVYIYSVWIRGEKRKKKTNKQDGLYLPGAPMFMADGRVSAAALQRTRDRQQPPGSNQKKKKLIKLPLDQNKYYINLHNIFSLFYLCCFVTKILF